MMRVAITEYKLFVKRNFKLKQKNWFIYILRCADNTLYTGITTDIERRLKEHNAKKSVTRYTRTRQPLKLVYQENVESRSAAGKREVQLKKLKKIEKELLIKQFVKKGGGG